MTEPERGLGLGTDEWVASHAERSAGTGSLGERVTARWGALPLVLRWSLPLLLAAVIPMLGASPYVLRVGVNLGLFALLALGLNVVVGYAGLLDLGYVAFYGFGAYAYAMLSSDKFGLHLPTLVTIPVVVALTAGFGLLLGLPSRRLLGDYLAIVTLFFGQVFVEFTLSADTVNLPWRDKPIDITGGANGISGADPFSILGYTFNSNRDYYYLLLATIVLVAVALHRINTSRVGRAWRSIGEDALAAEAMTVPVNRLKLLAFIVGAGLAGLTGTVFAAVQLGAYSSSFDLPLLILLYAAVILGGAGSLPGTLIGAAVMSLLPEILRVPEYGEILFFGLLVLGLVGYLRRPVRIGAVVAAVVGVGYAMSGLLLAIGVSDLAASQWTQGPLSRALGRWLFVPTDRTMWGNAAFVLLVVAIAAMTQAHGRIRLVLLPFVTWLAIFVWEVRLTTDPSITRQLIIGALLIVLMISRPQGILGKPRVEVL